ncbi:MAG: iron(III) transport system ATP-binding protein [Paracoccaceae bacterium]|jgi:iron(III) transport system ATP-binding protein
MTNKSDDVSHDTGLTVSGLSHHFGPQQILRDINLEVAPGEILCLLGPSGCGKTTTLRLIAGLEELQTGRIAWNDDVLADAGSNVPPEKRLVSLLFQDFALFPHLTVAQNVAFGLKDLSSDERDARVHEVLDQVGMSRYAASYPHFLSGGEQQRIALARARAPRPRIFLLDEPFSNLDTRLRNQLRDLCLHVLKKSESSSVIVTHDAEEAMFMGDKVAVMRDGEIVQVGPPEELYFTPNSAFVAGLFGEVNEITGRVVDGHVVTPLGRVCAPNVNEGMEVDVLVRPEALLVTEGAGAAAVASVITSRLLGRSSLLHLSVPNGEEGGLHLHSRVPGRMLPPEGTSVSLSLDEQNVFVFPKE